MSSEGSDFHPDGFLREQVVRRLRNQVVKLWGLADADTEALDPVIDLLLGACAVEFERTAHDMHASQARILERLAQLMLPEVFAGPQPAHGILHARPEIPFHTLTPDDQLAVDTEITENGKPVPLPIWFSPAASFPVSDAAVVCQAAGGRLVFYEAPARKGDILHAPANAALPAGHCWLGIQVGKKVESVETLTFFLDWKNDPDRQTYFSLLPQARWRVDGHLLEALHGLFRAFPPAGTDEAADLEAHVCHLYGPQFVTVQAIPPALRRVAYPPDFEAVFGADRLKKCTDELLWVQVQVPAGIPPAALTEMYCTLNCVPVLNRRLHTSNRPHSLSAKLNILPLATTDHFLAMRRVHSATREYREVSFRRIREVDDGSYSVRQGGVSTFDQRDASTMLAYLHDLLRDENAAFSALNHATLTTEIKTLEQGLARLHLHFVQKKMPVAERAHLLLHTRQAEDAWVEFWSCQGELANRLPAGKKARSAAPAPLRRDTLQLVTPTFGGRPPLTEKEKLHAYRYTLLARSRIVTEADIKAACFARLGGRLQSVELKKGYRTDSGSRTGFVRTVDVALTPVSEHATPDWPEACRDMQAHLERHKTFLTDIRVLAPATA